VQFLGVVQAGLGYAIIEEGLFQVVIGAFAWRRQ